MLSYRPIFRHLSPAEHKGPQSLHIGLYDKDLIAEPIGGSAPKFSGELTIKGLVKALRLPFSLSCPAQGSPIPSYRFVSLLFFLQSQLEAQLQSFHLTKKVPLWKEDLPCLCVSSARLKGLPSRLLGLDKHIILLQSQLEARLQSSLESQKVMSWRRLTPNHLAYLVQLRGLLSRLIG